MAHIELSSDGNYDAVVGEVLALLEDGPSPDLGPR
jgi:hypothetical protein